MTARLYLIPSMLGDTASIETIPAQTVALLQRLEHLVVETPKQARRFLQACGIRLSERRIQFYVLDEHTRDVDLPSMLEPLRDGADVGMLSDAGCPAIADPGAKLVRLAHTLGIEVMPLVGPSSIALALMASGLNGQCFTFHGYLPVEAQARTRALLALEKNVATRQQTQIFIETPYRNNQLFAAIIQTCAPSSLLTLAVDLTLPDQFIRTRSIVEWRTDRLDIHRRPAVFLLGAPAP
jgi:16S rRNA (cytidine1402-2'-O)-methyltransferase